MFFLQWLCRCIQIWTEVYEIEFKNILIPLLNKILIMKKKFSQFFSQFFLCSWYIVDYVQDNCADVRLESQTYNLAHIHWFDVNTAQSGIDLIVFNLIHIIWIVHNSYCSNSSMSIWGTPFAQSNFFNYRNYDSQLYAYTIISW